MQENFLQQNGFSEWDRYCPFYKTVWMLKNYILFYDLAQKAVQNSQNTDHKITLAAIKKFMGDTVIYKLVRMKFAVPTEGEEKLTRQYKETDRKSVV